MRIRDLNPSQKKLTAMFYVLGAAAFLPIILFTVLK
ncbi:hypothetical protein FG95_01947 [Sphingopyxis sp. LC363]|nr:hypothetical protein FG95_01947 [Sphingopyxis sp. LC363]